MVATRSLALMEREDVSSIAEADCLWAQYNCGWVCIFLLYSKQRGNVGRWISVASWPRSSLVAVKINPVSNATVADYGARLWATHQHSIRKAKYTACPTDSLSWLTTTSQLFLLLPGAYSQTIMQTTGYHLHPRLAEKAREFSKPLQITAKDQ